METVMQIHEFSSADDLFGTLKVEVPTRGLVRIFAFRISNFRESNYTFELKHNTTTFLTFQFSEVEEFVFQQTDHFTSGQQTLLELMDRLHEQTYENILSEQSETARRSGLFPLASCELRYQFDQADHFEAFCAELLALPDSTTSHEEAATITH